MFGAPSFYAKLVTADEFGRFVFEANILREDFIPRVNSAMFILASPSMSKRRKIAMSSCLVERWPIERKNRFRLLEST